MYPELRERDFEKISRLVYDLCGINLHDGKKELVKARLGKRIREGNFKSFADYYRHVTTPEGQDELIVMIDSLSTNLTYFFREDKHFQKLRYLVPPILNGGGRGRRETLRVWSAGCSTGEEPYSLAIALRETPELAGGDFRILATDISTRVLKTAVAGIYPAEKVERIPRDILYRYFQYGTGQSAGYYRVKKEVRDLVEFRRFNLMEEPPADFRFHVVFCRNVMIYFDKETQNAVVERFYRCLVKGGYLFVGHSESLTGLRHPFRYVEPSIYRKME
ncbi:MAG TPA: protein-glutamate O-methyltransferase CheR [Syntrophales bacterium]|nr:protein-glutamate O-methyltransferase CheR [Syntrophales bacterium]HOM07631.1 protein-glutamate O-methyltransferase CheR [Syntrophales bacterium]HOO00780.1 protein-glutamate O-methyltransferase CheR [Syntrophales bacterium]HPQ06684.1 protein-glutamate O-methyltransferase CheR [Syntrophales bacterium]